MLYGAMTRYFFNFENDEGAAFADLLAGTCRTTRLPGLKLATCVPMD